MTMPLAVPENDVLPVLAVRRLTLTAFRNYSALRLALTADPVVLTGPNGSGKTNILEALSLLVPGRGLRRARHSDWQNRRDATPWGVAADVDTPMGALKIGTGRDPSGGDRRAVTLDGRSARSQSVLDETMALAWVTPDLDRVLVDGAAARRKLIDRLTASFDPAHAGRLLRYEKALRERLRLLREGPADAAWLAALENTMAQTGVAIAAARRHLLAELNANSAATSGAFPQADLALIGFAEQALDRAPALDVEESLRAGLHRNRAADAESGACALGPHRSDLAVTHRARACPAELCSTGEQKALLIALMLAYVRALGRARGVTPLLLLDDIAAHLDRARREALFNEINALGAQAWLTGTAPDLFAPFLVQTQHFAIENGTVRF
jgi:DNA replication and repair protein RecF